MGVREQFELHTEFRYDADNVAVDALLMVIEDALGRGAVRTGGGEQADTMWARVHWSVPEADARLVNRLHEHLRTIGKYVHEPAQVRCSDSEGREQDYWLEPRRPAPGAAASSEEVEPDDPAAAAADDADPRPSGADVPAAEDDSHESDRSTTAAD